MSDLNKLTIKDAQTGIREKEFKPEELLESTLKSIHVKEGDIGAYITINEEDLSNEQVGDLTGIPLGIKDAILVKGLKATAGSQILKDYKAAYHSTAIEKLLNMGAVVIGKTNMDEFAMGSSTENSSFKSTHNPHDLERVPGGSSGGSAAAVAADMALGALGSDTGGSIRQPAALCGIVGLKPTYGAVSRYGLMALSSSLDQIGPMTKTVEDAAILFKAMAGYDPKDSTSNRNVQYSEELIKPDMSAVRKLKIGIPKEYFQDGLDKAVTSSMDEVIDWFKKQNFEVKEVSLPHTQYALPVYYIIMPAEASTNLARYDGIRYGTRGVSKSLEDLYLENKGEGFGPEVKRRITLGTFALSAGYYEAYYGRAQRVRSLIKQDFDKVFDDVDVLLTPTAPTVAFKLGEKTQDPLQMYLSDIFTIPANLAGIPAISIPTKGREGKLPVGFQLMGKNWREVDLLGLGMLYEQN